MPISANQTISLDGKLTLGINRWLSKTVGDLLLGNNPVFAMIKEKGNVVTDGLGQFFQEPLLVDAPGGPRAQGVSNAYDDLEHSPMTGITSSYYPPAEYAEPVSVTWRDQKTIRGKTQMVNLIESVFKAANKRFFAKLNADMWATEATVGSAGAVDRLASLRTLINGGGGSTTRFDTTTMLSEQTTAAIGTSPVTLVGGIERNQANNAFWCVPITNPGTDATFTLIVLNNQISLATRNDDTPNLAIVGRTGFDKLVTLLQGTGYPLIWDVPSVMKKFSSCQYRGCTIVFDDNVPVGSNATAGSYQLFIINTEYLKLQCDTVEPRAVQTQDPKRPLDTWLLHWVGQITSGHLGRVHARHGALIN